MGLQEQNWFFDIIRPIFGFFDRIVYTLIKWILYGVFDISALSTNSKVFNGIYSRIYVILGIFMAFKLSFSFFQYIVNPDSMSGKSEQGVGKLFTRVFLMLFALMFLPALLFGRENEKGLLFRAQDAFLPVVPRLIFGADSVGGNNGVNGNASSVEEMSNEISLATLRGFFFPSKEVDEVCAPGTSSKYKEITSLDEFASKIKETCSKRSGLAGLFSPKYYVYSYLPFVSTVVGVLVAALLLGITLDIAKRLFKLIILEVIAPIPIMSLIDPKSSKGGAFQSWVKSLISTFVDIFLKMGLVYLIIVLIHMIVRANESGGLFNNYPQFSDNPVRSTYLTVLLILGLIFFAKEAPKFIKDALGIKDSGGGLFDDVKTLGKAAGLVGGAAVGATTAIAGGIAQGANTEGNFLKKLGVGAGSAALGGAAGLLRGGVNGFQGANKGNPLAGINKAISSQSGINANKVANARAGSNVFGRTAARFGGIVGMAPADLDERKISGYKAVADSAKEFEEEMDKRAKGMSTNVSGYGFRYAEYRAAMDTNDSAWATSHGFSSLADAKSKDKGITDTAKADAYNYSNGLTAADADFDKFAKFRELEKITRQAAHDAEGISDFHDYSGFDAAKSNSSLRSIQIRSSDKYTSRKRSSEAVKKKK